MAVVIEDWSSGESGAAKREMLTAATRVLVRQFPARFVAAVVVVCRAHRVCPVLKQGAEGRCSSVVLTGGAEGRC